LNQNTYWKQLNRIMKNSPEDQEHFPRGHTEDIPDIQDTHQNIDNAPKIH